MIDALRFHRIDGRTLTFHLGARVLSIEEHASGSCIAIDTLTGVHASSVDYVVRETPAEVEAILETRAEKVQAAWKEKAAKAAKRRKEHRVGVLREMPTEEFGLDNMVEEAISFDPMTMAGGQVPFA